MCCAIFLVPVTFEKPKKQTQTKNTHKKNMAAAESDANQIVQSELLGTDDSGTVKINWVFTCKIKRQSTFLVYLQRKPLPSS